MQDAVYDCIVACNWKLTSLLRSRRFFCDAELVLFFKSHLLSFIEYRTAGIFHASVSVLAPLDRILTRFLKDINVSAVNALMHFNLAPLKTRRDIAILGIIHRAVLKLGPPQLHSFFMSQANRPRFTRHWHRHILEDPCNIARPDFFTRSIFGSIAIYNLLPDFVVATQSVQSFQSKLQSILKFLVQSGYDHWDDCFSRRICLVNSNLPSISQ